MCGKEVDKYKETLSANDIKGKEKTLSMSEKKEKSRDGYVCIYEYGKHLLHSIYERTCAAHDTAISQMKEIVEIFNYEIN